MAPQEGVAPIMTLAGVVAVHPWLDARMRVIGYPPIVSDIQWSSFNITLGKAVNEVVQYFQLNPPTIQQITDQSLAKLQHQQQQPTHLRQPSQPPHYLGNPPPPTYEAAMQSDDFSPRSGEPFHMPIPAVPSTFPELNSMSQDQLKTLLNEQEAFSKYVDSMNAVTTITDLQTSIVEGNVDSAKANLARQEELETLHAEVSVLKSTLNERIAHFHKLEKRQKELSTPADPRTVVKQLQVVKREAFTESERIASDWLASDDSGGNSSTASVDDFLSAFMKKRELYHLRGAKIERLSGAH